MSTSDWIKIALIGSIATISLVLAQTSSLDPKKASEIFELAGPYSEILDMAFSPDGKYLAVSSDLIVRIWDVEQGRIAVKLTGHTNGVFGLSYYNDGKNLVTVGNDELLKTWDVASGKETSSLKLKCYNGGTGDVVVLKDNRALVACAGLQVVDLKTRKILSAFKGPDTVDRLALSPDQRTILGSIRSSVFQLWDVQSQEPFRQLKGPEYGGSAVSYSANGKFLATGAIDDTARIWNAANGKELFVLKEHKDRINDVAFSPDSKMLVSASGDDTIKFWNVATGEELATLEGHQNDVEQLAWSKDGKMLASGDRNGVVKLWGNP